jgi:electron transfer flavoprotein alpha subunit
MAETILAVLEQRQGKLNRVSFETITAAQAIAAESGWSIEACVVGSGISAIASEVAGKKMNKVYALESNALAAYTPDGYVYALKQFISDKKPRLVLMPHTYQVRDFVPQLTTALGTTVISDCTGYKKEGDQFVFTRQMFQGKFAADVAFAGDGPHFATLQAGSFRGDKAEDGASVAPVETVQIQIPDGVIRTRPERKSLLLWAAESKNRKISRSQNNWQTLSAAKSQRPVRSAMQAGFRWSARLVRPVKPSRPRYTSRSGSAAPSSTLSA